MKTIQNKKKTLIIYHKEDADGLFSASICWNAILENNKDKVKYNLIKKHINIKNYINIFNIENNLDKIDLLGTTYAELSELIVKYGSYTNLIDSWYKKYSQIIMTDISFNETKAMKYIYNKFSNNFVWFDHHAPIIEASLKEGFGDICGTREMYSSAIMHAWNYFYSGIFWQSGVNIDRNNISFLVRALSGYDSFNWIQHGIDFDTAFQTTRGFEFYVKKNIIKTIEFVTKYIIKYNIELLLKNDNNFISYCCENYKFSDEINNFIPYVENIEEQFKKQGKTIVEYEEYKWKNMIETCGDFEWYLDGKYSEKRKAVAIFTQGQTCSTYFKSLKKTHPNIQNAIVFKKNPQNEEWAVSVYNINIEDDKAYHVGNYLKKKYKRGGGHAGAGGATLTQTQFLDCLKNKHL